MKLTGTASFLLFSCFTFYGCREKAALQKENDIRFTSLPSSSTNIHFNNLITENDSVNLIANAYAYMGSGAGIGDFNNDGLPDVFLGASQQSSRLYLNKGNFVFDDITEKAGVQTSSWITGVSVADVNADGFDDIYVCASVNKDPQQRKNKLFINNGDLTFSERANAYGLDDTLYSTQAVFFDYDKDGDLDMYLLNHLLNHLQSNVIAPRDVSGNAPARDKLFRNNGIKKGTNHPWFEDVSSSCGIIEDGYGLGVVVSDMNNDGWPDIYVANDYLANDLLWLNNRNGTFTNSIARSMKHQSYSSMGVDAGDINNDGLPDVISLDMLPEDNERKKMMFSFMNYDRYVMERRAGYEDEYMRNMLQLNNGERTISDTTIPFFSEIGQMAGIFETDWSWSVLMADFDNDGWKDVHITNGLGRDMINNDFISFLAAPNAAKFSNREEMNRAVIKKLDEYGTVELNNYCFRNNGNLRFTNIAGYAGEQPLSISNGCAYADLDNDGDMDLIVNNINREAFVLKNEARATEQDTTHNFLSISLAGDSLNKNGFGAKLLVYAGNQKQSAEQTPVRGYLSSVDKKLHFGLGNNKIVDSLLITWPDGKQQLLNNVAVNKTITLKKEDANTQNRQALLSPNYLFADVTTSKGLNFKHKETFFYDYGFQQLLPQKYSHLGPFLTEGDINGDGLTDFFIGGAANQSGRFFIQQANGNFIIRDLVPGNKPQEDLGCLLFDADGDKDLDLFVNSGSNEFDPGSSNYLPRLYINDGAGNFASDNNAFPKTIFTSAQSVAGADYDGDGDIDLFIGGRIFPKQYPMSPESYLLQNNGGKFTVVTQEVCAALQNAGMITAALWTDLNNDKKPDLVIAGEFMPVRFFLNEGGQLKETKGPENMEGQWRSLAAADIDSDGDMDIVAGNLGLNNKYQASPEHPIKLFAKDLDGNGSVDPVLAYYIKNAKGTQELFPAIGRDQFAAQVPVIKKKFLLHHEYSRTGIDKLFSDTDKEDMIQLNCNETRSIWLENTGNGKFALHELPLEAQFAPVNSILYTDADGDGRADLIVAGNEYQTEVMTGRYDASYGLVLKGDGKGGFITLPPAVSGLLIDGDVKDMKLLNTVNKEKLLLVGINDENIKSYRLR